MKTLGDVVVDLNLIYGHRVKNLVDEKKGDRGRIFKEIILELFQRYGKALGYDDIHLFQSALVNLKNLKNISPEYSDRIEGEIIFERKPRIPKENDLDFTAWQIAEFGLNPDNY